MTRIDFHFNAPDRLGYACRLTRKIYRSGKRIVIFDTRPQGLDEFSQALWSFSALDFIPHVRWDDPLMASTPIVLACEPFESPHHEVLVNLCDEPPPFFSRFERLIEVVAAEHEEQRAKARLRFRHYKDRGYPIETFDLSAVGMK
jgi:DNA polymerase-3 subunit chi